MRVKNTRVRSVEVAVREIRVRGPFADSVTCVRADVCEDVGADVPAA